MAGSEEQKRRAFHVERATRIAESQLAHKVLNAIDRVSPTKEHGEMRDPFAVKTSIELAVRSVLRECGVEIHATSTQKGNKVK